MPAMLPSEMCVPEAAVRLPYLDGHSGSAPFSRKGPKCFHRVMALFPYLGLFELSHAIGRPNAA